MGRTGTAGTPGRRRPALRTCTVITTEAGPDMGDIHHRMPVVLEPEVLDEWLDPANRDKPELESLLVPSPGGTLVHRAVGRAVGNVRNDGPELIEALAEGWAPPNPGRVPCDPPRAEVGRQAPASALATRRMSFDLRLAAWFLWMTPLAAALSIRLTADRTDSSAAASSAMAALAAWCGCAARTGRPCCGPGA